MEITEAQYARIDDSLPVQRGNVSLSNLQLLNALLYIAEHGCKWRGLPKRFGNGHTIYTCMNRWSKNGMLGRVFQKLQLEQIVRIGIEAFTPDSTSVKVHPDGTGATAPLYRADIDGLLLKNESLSLNQFIMKALAEKVSALRIERARQANAVLALTIIEKAGKCTATLECRP